MKLTLPVLMKAWRPKLQTMKKSHRDRDEPPMVSTAKRQRTPIPDAAGAVDGQNFGEEVDEEKSEVAGVQIWW